MAREVRYPHTFLFDVLGTLAAYSVRVHDLLQYGSYGKMIVQQKNTLQTFKVSKADGTGICCLQRNTEHSCSVYTSYYVS